MELKHVRCFVVLADQLHYGHAANRLFMTQSALSKHIAALERELGVILFDRSRRHVHLTEAGRQLLPEAERIVGLTDRFTATARRLCEGSAGALRLGYSGAVSGGVLTGVLRAFHAAHPDVTLALRESPSHSGLLNDVADRLLDAAFVRYIRSTPGLTTTEVLQERTVVAVHEGHPFHGRESVWFAELRDQPLVMLAREVDPEVYDHAMSLCAEAGFRPTVVHESDSAQTSLAMVASGLGLAVVTSSAVTGAWSGLRAVPLEDPSLLRVWLAHRTGDPNPALMRLVEIVGASK